MWQAPLTAANAASAAARRAGWEPSLEASPTRPVRALMGRVRAFDARYPVWWDLLPVLGLGFLAYLAVRGGGWRVESRLDDLAEAVAWTQAATSVLPLLLRRRYPFATFAAMAVPGALGIWAGLVAGVIFCTCVALYEVALRSTLPRLALSGGLLALAAAVWLWRWPEDDAQATCIRLALLFLVFVLAGFVVRTRRDYIAALLDRARRLEVERDQRERLAAAAERARIAREMHDIIGHNLGVITGLADGGSYAARASPERAAQALEAIATTSRQALGELRRLLGVLREESADPEAAAELAPQPGLADVDALLARVREAGLPVRSTVTGGPAELSAGAQLTVYRVVQEALTNTLKHGGPGVRADVTLARLRDGLEVTVSDDGRGAEAPSGAGQGIKGMRERAAVYDGTLEAGPRPGGGWRVRLRLPLRGDDT